MRVGKLSSHYLAIQTNGNIEFRCVFGHKNSGDIQASLRDLGRLCYNV